MIRELPKPLYVLLGARAGGFLRPSYFYFIGERKMELKGPLSFSQQVKRLQEHGMCISDPKDAERKLSKINYYRFTGYALSLAGIERVIDTFQVPILIWYTVSISLMKN